MGNILMMWWNAVQTNVVALVNAILAYVWVGLEIVWEWLKGILSDVLAEVWTGLLGVLPDDWTAAIRAIHLDDWSGVLHDLSWIFPVVPCMTMIGTAYTVSGTIRLIRWVKSCVPTVSGA